MAGLSDAQQAQFWRDGFLVIENAVDADLLKTLQDDFAGWVEESRTHSEPYGDTVDGRPRFDLEPGHTSEKPGLRRVQRAGRSFTGLFRRHVDQPHDRLRGRSHRA